MFCLTAGALAVTLATQSLTLVWTHSVEKTDIEEDYSLAGDRLVLTEARIKGSGAGFDPPPEARLEGGWWRWQPGITLKAVTLARADAPGDWRICFDRICHPLRYYLSANDDSAARITACPADPGR